jgi:hypothetical protein
MPSETVYPNPGNIMPSHYHKLGDSLSEPGAELSRCILMSSSLKITSEGCF